MSFEDTLDGCMGAFLLLVCLGGGLLYWGYLTIHYKEQLIACGCASYDTTTGAFKETPK